MEIIKRAKGQTNGFNALFSKQKCAKIVLTLLGQARCATVNSMKPFIYLLNMHFNN